MTIKAARAEAARLVNVEKGHASMALSDAMDEYMELIIRPQYKRSANAEVYARRIKNRLGTVSLEVVRPRDVSRLISAYAQEKPVAAMRALGFAKGFFKWCVGIGYLERSPVVEIEAKAFGVEEKARERILTDDEIRTFWHSDDLLHRPLLRFLLLTGLRIGEAQAAQVEWIAADHWLQMPAEVMKNGKPHKVFLSPLAYQQIEPDAKPALFKAVSPTAVQAGLHRWHDRHKVESRWTPHDLRRSFASRLGNLNVAIHIIAKCLSHTLEGGGESTSVYVRSEWLDERQKATAMLAQHVASVVKAKP